MAKNYVEARGVRVHASALASGKLAAEVHGVGDSADVDRVMTATRSVSQLHDVTPDLARDGGMTRAERRAKVPDASLADGIVLATARPLGARLISNDPAFEGLDDVAAT